MIAPVSPPPTSARDTILARIREALRVPAPVPHLKSHTAEQSVMPAAASGLPALTVLPAEGAKPWLPDGGDTPAERVRIFTENIEKLRGVPCRVTDFQAAAEAIATLARERGWQRVAGHAHPFVEPVLAHLPCSVQRVDGSAGFDKNALEACDAGITACEAAVAQTGSILVSSRTCGGRGLSILPHVHIAVLTVDQVVATVGDALHLTRERAAGRMPSMLSFITGPSRTGDIERILVLGAHGPKELFVFLVG
jgi:L-lactate dehydrogenase complex protein LldG